jgi:hypothetical protein
MNDVTISRIGAPLQYIPVRHACGHFELRLTRWNGFDPSTTADPANAAGYLSAGSVCSGCSPMGGAIAPHVDTLAEAQDAAAMLNDGRGCRFCLADIGGNEPHAPGCLTTPILVDGFATTLSYFIAANPPNDTAEVLERFRAGETIVTIDLGAGGTLTVEVA